MRIIFSKSSFEQQTPSMCRWMMLLGEKVTPVVDDIMAQMKQLPYIQADETPVVVLKDKDHPAGSHKGYMWVYNNSEGCVYKYGSRAGEHVKSELDTKEFQNSSERYLLGYQMLN